MRSSKDRGTDASTATGTLERRKINELLNSCKIAKLIDFASGNVQGKQYILNSQKPRTVGRPASLESTKTG